MSRFRRLPSSRWWNNRKTWLIFLFSIFFILIKISNNLFVRDFYYLISKPFWPGQFQREILLRSYQQEVNIKLNQLENDNRRLRQILSLQNLSDINVITSAVISRNNGNWWKQIILNKGAQDGVKIGDAVVGPGGLLGIIDNTSYFTSNVKLLTDPDSKVGVWTKRSNKHGLMVGVGNEKPQIIYYSKEVDIKVGDLVLSSPASTLLPPNIPIGIVENIDQSSKPVATATVQLTADPNAIDWVQVLKLKFE